MVKCTITPDLIRQSQWNFFLKGDCKCVNAISLTIPVLSQWNFFLKGDCKFIVTGNNTFSISHNGISF